jgi:hypothetical protein
VVSIEVRQLMSIENPLWGAPLVVSPYHRSCSFHDGPSATPLRFQGVLLATGARSEPHGL